MAESGVTMHSDSELYSGAEEDLQTIDDAQSTASSQGDGRPIILYRPPTLWSLFRGATINLFLPFVNGMMMGFGELFAHEFAFRLGWSGTRVCCHIPALKFFCILKLIYANLERSFLYHGDKHMRSDPVWNCGRGGDYRAPAS